MGQMLHKQRLGSHSLTSSPSLLLLNRTSFPLYSIWDSRDHHKYGLLRGVQNPTITNPPDFSSWILFFYPTFLLAIASVLMAPLLFWSHLLSLHTFPIDYITIRLSWKSHLYIDLMLLEWKVNGLILLKCIFKNSQSQEFHFTCVISIIFSAVKYCFSPIIQIRKWGLERLSNLPQAPPNKQ